MCVFWQAEMQSAIGAEYKAKYEGVVSTQKDKIKLLQSKNAQMQKKHEGELKDAERKGASVAMTKMAKAMKQVSIGPSCSLWSCAPTCSRCTGQAKKQQQKEAAKAQQQAERQHQKELRRAKAMAIQAQGGAVPKVKKELVQEGEQAPIWQNCARVASARQSTTA
jgi:hypothetical protein|eukprot:COSAG02_NODE_5475_length_4294_cov_2.033850_4_plen_165_part_00